MADRATFDWQLFARVSRQALQSDGRGYRTLADIIGVTFTDLSRAASGKVLSAHKVFAICDWIGVSARAFYAGPKHKHSKNKLLQSAQRETLGQPR